MIGLDPYLGAFHSVEYGKPSLALDLMEEWRSVIVDTLVLSIFNLNVINESNFKIDLKDQQDMFLEHTTPVKLTPEGLRKFITQYERKIRQKIKHHLTGTNLSYRDCIREQVRHFARYLRGEDQYYKPIPYK